MNEGQKQGSSVSPGQPKAPSGKVGQRKPGFSKAPRIPPQIFAEAKRLETANGLTFAMALRVAKGDLALKDALALLLLHEKVQRLVQEKILMIRHATPVLTGVCTLEKGLFLSAVAYRKAAEDYRLCHFDKYVGTGTPLVLGLVDKRTLTGVVVDSPRYDVLIKAPEGEEHLLQKHDVKFYYEASSKKAVLKHLEWGAKEQRTLPGALATVKARKDLPAKEFIQPQRAGKTVSISNTEGDLFRGRVTWVGKWELVLELGPGVSVVLLRHCLVGVDS